MPEYANGERHHATTLADRRAPSQEMLLLITEIKESQMELKESQIELKENLTRHMQEETGELARAITQLMKEAFPEGDPDGHRRRHELELEQLKEKTEFWKKMRLELAKWGLIGFVIWGGNALWNAMLLGPHKQLSF